MAQNEADADGIRGVIINTASIAAMDGQMGQVCVHDNLCLMYHVKVCCRDKHRYVIYVYFQLFSYLYFSCNDIYRLLMLHQKVLLYQ